METIMAVAKMDTTMAAPQLDIADAATITMENTVPSTVGESEVGADVEMEVVATVPTVEPSKKPYFKQHDLDMMKYMICSPDYETLGDFPTYPCPPVLIDGVEHPNYTLIFMLDVTPVVEQTPENYLHQYIIRRKVISEMNMLKVDPLRTWCNEAGAAKQDNPEDEPPHKITKKPLPCPSKRSYPPLDECKFRTYVNYYYSRYVEVYCGIEYNVLTIYIDFKDPSMLCGEFFEREDPSYLLDYLKRHHLISHFAGAKDEKVYPFMLDDMVVRHIKEYAMETRQPLVGVPPIVYSNFKTELYPHQVEHVNRLMDLAENRFKFYVDKRDRLYEECGLNCHYFQIFQKDRPVEQFYAEKYLQSLYQLPMEPTTGALLCDEGHGGKMVTALAFWDAHRVKNPRHTCFIVVRNAADEIVWKAAIAQYYGGLSQKKVGVSLLTDDLVDEYLLNYKADVMIVDKIEEYYATFIGDTESQQSLHFKDLCGYNGRGLASINYIFKLGLTTRPFVNRFSMETLLRFLVYPYDASDLTIHSDYVWRQIQEVILYSPHRIMEDGSVELAPMPKLHAVAGAVAESGVDTVPYLDPVAAAATGAANPSGLDDDAEGDFASPADADDDDNDDEDDGDNATAALEDEDEDDNDDDDEDEDDDA
jgi:hypothetical protein